MMSAIPTAAAEPARQWFGICQKTGIADMVPTIASARAASDRAGLAGRTKPRAMRPVAPASAAKAQW
ncbi:hypothetical protein D9M72_579630 [compost metagenome]